MTRVKWGEKVRETHPLIAVDEARFGVVFGTHSPRYVTPLQLPAGSLGAFLGVLGSLGCNYLLCAVVLMDSEAGWRLSAPGTWYLHGGLSVDPTPCDQPRRNVRLSELRACHLPPFVATISSKTFTLSLCKGEGVIAIPG